MRLSQIKLAGFKSFVDPTTVPFPTNLTGVVGPNGCGKSNIIDAVRWVMGESSAKNLRGDSMTDVIFNGSSSRKPVGQAAIELIFDNSEGGLGGAYADYSEIAIRRLVTRDGQSSYFLNGTRCRRRDITDIFLGTGLGPRSYAIIEQGTISRLIEARPEELRQFLEEAAGISKYKERRKETERRMAATRENLDRLNDIRDELGKQLERLQRQAESAERFKQLKGRERQLRQELLALRWRALEQSATTQAATVTRLELESEAILAAQRQAEAELEQQRQHHLDAQGELNTVQGEYYRLGSELIRCEQAIGHSRERSRSQQQSLTELKQQQQRRQQQLIADRMERDRQQLRLEELQPQQQQTTAALAEIEGALAESEAAQRQWQQAWDRFHQHAAEPTQRAEVERARISQLEQQQQQGQKRRLRLREEQLALQPDDLTEELTELAEQIAEQQQREEESAALQQEQSAELALRRQQLRHAESERNRLRQQLHQQQGQLASLTTLQQAALTESSSNLPDQLQQQGIAPLHRLAESLQVVSGWEQAVEAILQQGLEAIALTTTAPIVWERLNPSGGGMLLHPPHPLPPTTAPLAGEWLQSLVSGEFAPVSLLYGVIAVADLATARSLQPQLAPQQQLVTRDGIICGVDWIRWPTPTADGQGVLQRQRQLEQLQHHLTALEAELAQQQQQLQLEESRLEQLQQQLQQSQQQQSHAQRERLLLEGKRGAKQARWEQMQQRQQRLEEELEELEEQLLVQREQLATATLHLTTALEQAEQFALERDRLQQQRQQWQQQLQQQQPQRERLRQQQHQLELQQQQAESRLHAAELAAERGEEEFEQLYLQIESLEQTLLEAELPLAALQEQLADRLEQRAELELQLEQQRRRVAELEHTLRGSDQRRLESEQRYHQLRQQWEQQRLTLQEQRLRQQSLLEQLQSHNPDAQLEPLLAGLPAHAPLREWEAELTQLNDQINRLGTINLAAIEEYAQQSERKRYLDAQSADLYSALETLESAIRKIDRETRQRFKQIFDAVNSGLQHRFPRLFGGGNAYLELLGDDLLDTGVTIMARPPGKRNSTIHLLSGGEKALTAVALVFTIFELNPSPFCMLDEVDAPLDEANVGRFCAMVREMSQQVQFIFITHNKVTMELASTLAGVTMHEPGVSRMVAVNIEEAVELAALSE